VANTFLQEAEALERSASEERVSYLETLGLAGLLLDVGCGNGYAVAEWRGRGVRAVGVDASFYRASRWLVEKQARSLVIADATALPFREGQFRATYSSGLIEHVGVDEQGGDVYRVTARPDKHERRRRAVEEMCRVTSRRGSVILDFPNGMFPIDFWHGTSLASFRLHRLPDTLNPSVWDISRYVPGRQVTILPLRNRLRFRQVSRKWWGRALHGPAEAFIRLLDLLPRALRVHGVLYPFLVVRIQPADHEA
jgi:SAM-dependent methyltransferase